MNTSTVANRLIELCLASKFLEAQHELYDTDITRVETDGTVTTGKETMHKQEQRFLDRVEKINSTHFSSPMIAGKYFTVVLTMELELKNIGKTPLEEICVYKVEGGKIVFEQFFRG